MADTVRPCRCSSRIIMSSPSVTTVLLPPAKGSSIGGDGVGPPRGKCPRRPAATTKLGKIRGPQMGRIHRPLTVREYQGERHTVTVVPDGFVWRGTIYGSLSTIA